MYSVNCVRMSRERWAYRLAETRAESLKLGFALVLVDVGVRRDDALAIIRGLLGAGGR